MKKINYKRIIFASILTTLFSIESYAAKYSGTGYVKLVASEHSGFSGIADDYIIIDGFTNVGSCQVNSNGEAIIRIGNDSASSSDAHRSYMTAMTAKISGALVRVSVDDAETDQDSGVVTLSNGQKLCYLRYIHLI